MSDEAALALEPNPVQEPEKRNSAQWIQLPRRLLYLLLAYALARLLLFALPSFLPGSFSETQATEEIIARRLPGTLQLLFAAFFLALLLALLPLLVGVLADILESRNGIPGSIVKGLGRLAVFPLGSLPVVALGTLLLTTLISSRFRLNALPGSEFDPVSLFLAALTLAFYPAMVLAQSTTRTFTLPRPVSTARRAGAAILFALGALFAQTAGILSAGMIVEVIFNLPGLGRLLLQSIFAFDFSVSFAVLAVFLFLVFWGRFLAEIFRAGARLVLADTPVSEAEPSSWRRKARIIWVIFALVWLLIPAGIAGIGLVTPDERTLEQEIANRNAAPSPEHPFGTDELGRDVLARAFKGAWRLIAYSGLVATAVLIISAPLGVLTGYLSNRRTWQWETISDTILLFFDIWLMFPLVPLLILLVAVLSISGRSGVIAMLMALVFLPRGIRAVQTMWHAGLHRDQWWIHIVLVAIAMFLAMIYASFIDLLAIDFLGFLGQAPVASLGLSLSNAMRNIFTSPWAVYYAGWLILLISFPFYLAADAFIGPFRTKEVMVRLNE